MNIKKLNEELGKFIVYETAERYLKATEVGPSIKDKNGMCAKTRGFDIRLVQGNEIIKSKDGNDHVGISLMMGPKFSEISDKAIRNTAKKYFDNITDDIRVVRTQGE